MRHFCRHADGIKQRGVWVDGCADVHTGSVANGHMVKRWTHVELWRADQLADLALIAALCSEEGDEVDGERAEGC